MLEIYTKYVVLVQFPYLGRKLSHKASGSIQLPEALFVLIGSN